jgi:hypothetical protein
MQGDEPTEVQAPEHPAQVREARLDPAGGTTDPQRATSRHEHARSLRDQALRELQEQEGTPPGG